MEASEDCINMIKSFEALELTAYKDIVGVWTIGWGSTEGVYEGMTVTEEQAEQMLRNSVDNIGHAILRLVHVPLNQNEFDALVDFCYNLGTGRLQTSTLLRKLNGSDRSGAAQEFLRWCKAGGAVVDGLLRRREAERVLFLSA